MKAQWFFELDEISTKSPPGQHFHIGIDQLTPTQNAVGMDEVNAKALKIAECGPDKMKEYLYLRPIPVVIGQDRYHLIDRHHMARALWQAAGDETNRSGMTRKNCRAVAKVAENWQYVESPKRFWKAMDKKRWVYPFDHGGGGPLNVACLKEHVKHLENDPYRSLAWYVRERFGYFKDEANPIFAEFKWANFFRTRVRLGDDLLDPDSGKEGLEQIMIEDLDVAIQRAVIGDALALSRSDRARHLPGFIGG